MVKCTSRRPGSGAGVALKESLEILPAPSHYYKVHLLRMFDTSSRSGITDITFTATQINIVNDIVNVCLRQS